MVKEFAVRWLEIGIESDLDGRQSMKNNVLVSNQGDVGL